MKQSLYDETTHEIPVEFLAHPATQLHKVEKMNRNRRYSVIDSNLKNMNSQDPEGVPSHRCLILDQSFEALKSARSSTETMKGVKREMEMAVNTEGEKNEIFQQNADYYASFSDEIANTEHGMESIVKETAEEIINEGGGEETIDDLSNADNGT